MKRAEAEILTVDDLAELFACDKETAAARLTSGDLPGVKVGRGWIIPRQAFFERLNEKAKEESAARRAQRADIYHGANDTNLVRQTASSQFANTPPAALLPTIGPQSRGRKRRLPPVLPRPAG